MKPIPCTLGYIIRGVGYSKDQREALSEELKQTLEHAAAVIALPVVDGISLEMEVTDIAPFSTDSYEPYICEHVLAPAVAARCDVSGERAELKLINKRFS